MDQYAEELKTDTVFWVEEIESVHWEGGDLKISGSVRNNGAVSKNSFWNLCRGHFLVFSVDTNKACSMAECHK